MRVSVLAVCVSGCTEPIPFEDAGPGSRFTEPCDECETAQASEDAGCEEPEGSRSFPCEGHCHLEEDAEFSWGHEPPHSGDHSTDWAHDWGEHTDAVERKHWVHNLEHGGVVLLHDCGAAACDAELDVLRDVVAAASGIDLRVLMTPDPLLGPPFAAVAWTWVYETDDPDLDTLLCFFRRHVGNAREDVM